jgi:hypothetical protein
LTEKPAGDDAPKAVFRTFNTRAEADLVSNVLAGAGIASFVASDDCGAIDPALSFVRGVKVLVAQEDFETAEALLEDGDLPSLEADAPSES